MIRSKVQQTLDSLFADLSDAIPMAEKQLMDLAIDFRQTMAKAVEPVINQFIANSSPSDLQTFQSVATHVNHVLEMTGQCVVVDGQTALLTGTGGEGGRSDSLHLVLKVHRGRNRVDRIVVDTRDPQLRLTPLTAASREAIDQLYHSCRGRQGR